MLYMVNNKCIPVLQLAICLIQKNSQLLLAWNIKEKGLIFLKLQIEFLWSFSETELRSKYSDFRFTDCVIVTLRPFCINYEDKNKSLDSPMLYNQVVSLESAPSLVPENSFAARKTAVTLWKAKCLEVRTELNIMVNN